MKIVALVENMAAREDLQAEHGLSLYIEAAGRRVLFDMGQSGLFAENAEKLGVDLTMVDTAIVSHGHYDHGGGLETFLKINGSAPVYLSRSAFDGHFNADGKDIGLDPRLRDNPRLRLTEGITGLGDGLTLYAASNIGVCNPVADSGMTFTAGGVTVPEDFRHEQYLLIEEAGKRVLISGCSHKGILDIENAFRPDVLVGGFHFFKLPVDQILTGYGKYLDGFETRYYTCHCTGAEQFDHLKQHMSRLNYLACGQVLEISGDIWN